MTTEVTTRPVTADELLEMPRGRVRRELIRGEVVEMTPAGAEHGKIALRIGARLLAYVDEHELGSAYAAETGFRIESDPDTVRAPDAAFVSHERLASAPGTRGYWPGAPDLAIEVISPSDRFTAVEAKVFDWLDAGCRMVVVLDPGNRSATVYRSRDRITSLTDADTLDGDDVVPGWHVPLREIFG